MTILENHITGTFPMLVAANENARATIIERVTQANPEEAPSKTKAQPLTPDSKSGRYVGLDFDIYLAQYYLSKRNDARMRGLDFNLTLTQVRNMLKAKVCPITECKLTHTRGGGVGQRGTDITIDRIDSQKGYVAGNVIAMSHRANSLKSHFESDLNYNILHNLSRFLENRRIK